MLPENQTVIITGASSGIGAEIAKRFAHEGYELLLFGRDQDRLAKVKTECKNNKTEILAFDLAEINNHISAIQEKLSLLTTPTVLINNAGLLHRGLLEDTTDDVWFNQFQVNLLSAVQLTRLLWPIFKKNKKGSVVNISSTLGLKPTLDTGAYSAMRAAMINWTLSLAQEGGLNNIRANCICPGVVDTPIHSFHFLNREAKKIATDAIMQYQILHEIGKPEYIADAALFLASEKSCWTTGAVLNVDGGINIK